MRRKKLPGKRVSLEGIPRLLGAVAARIEAGDRLAWACGEAQKVRSAERGMHVVASALKRYREEVRDAC